MFGKSTEGFRTLGTNLEPDTMNLGLDETPVDRFFVCSAGAAPDIDHDTWSLRVDGDAVGAPIELGLDDLLALPQHRVSAWLECTGNGRLLFDHVGGHRRSSDQADAPWTLGAMGQALWEGPSLRSVLESVDVSADAAWLGPEGLDVENTEGHPVQMSLPLDKALDPDTIIAVRMNGEPLVDAHGAPARLLVPGWVGAYSVKWLGRIEISTSWISTWRSDTYYVRRRPDGSPIGPATTHPIKSSLALDWPATLTSGRQEIIGYARSSNTTIERVEWAVDDDAGWAEAELVAPAGPWQWTPFRFMWDAEPGEHTIRTRAWDLDGNHQPDTIDFSPTGFLWNAVTPHPVIVT